MCLHKIYITTQYKINSATVQRSKKFKKVYGPFYRIGAKSGWKYFENLYVLFPKRCPYIYIVPYLKYTYLVNEPSFFILYFQNVLECFSSPKNCHYRNIVINYSKNVLLLTCSDCVSFPSLKSIFFTMKSIKMKFLPNFKVQFIQFIKI